MTFTYANFENTVGQLETNPELHARFLNTLSLLEYMGARKILKSQQEAKISAQLLAHVAEEIRHAQTFKKLALKMSNDKLSSYSEDHLLCGSAAKEYFQSLDQAVHEEMGDNSYANYLYTTLLIEERANQVYPVYEPILARAGFPGVLKAIVKEEDGHLKDILNSLADQEKDPANARDIKSKSISVDKMIELRMLEAAAFEKFISSVYMTIQTQGQKLEKTSDLETQVDSKKEETQPGLTRGNTQESNLSTRSNPNHASGSGNAPLQ